MSTSNSSDFQQIDSANTRSKATLPDVSQLISELNAEEAASLGAIPAWKAAVDDAKRVTRIDDAEPLSPPTELSHHVTPRAVAPSVDAPSIEPESIEPEAIKAEAVGSDVIEATLNECEVIESLADETRTRESLADEGVVAKSTIPRIPNSSERQIRIDRPEEHIQPLEAAVRAATNPAALEDQASELAEIVDRKVSAETASAKIQVGELTSAAVATLRIDQPSSAPGMAKTESIPAAKRKVDFGALERFGATALATLKRFFQHPWTKKIGKYSAIVIITTSTLMLLDRRETRTPTADDSLATESQAPLHKEPLRDAHAAQQEGQHFAQEIRSKARNEQARQDSTDRPSDAERSRQNRPDTPALMASRPQPQGDRRRSSASTAQGQDRDAYNDRGRNDRNSTSGSRTSGSPDAANQRRALDSGRTDADWDRQAARSRVNEGRDFVGAEQDRFAVNESQADRSRPDTRPEDSRRSRSDNGPVNSRGRERNDSMNQSSSEGPQFNASGYKTQSRTIDPVDGYQYEETKAESYQYPQDAIPQAVSTLIRNRKIR